MPEHDRYERRMDQQDAMLREILERMATHRAEHEAIDPSVKELVGILKGVKFMKATTILLASILGSVWLIWLWAKDHVKL
jgi:hypothetical protein